ncbi:MAG TPA: hypothetical protein VK400_11965 [Pyrinomonadaceae bacterium]|nr:hypothetical protein [Pyrinomonadaceae bacterium]
MFENPLTRRIAEFLDEIGLPIFPKRLDENTFLSGILIENGKIFVDESRLAFPGDLLHEAGHLAVVPKNLRARLNDEIALPTGEFNIDAVEVAAIAWSYAAALHLGLDPRVVFHAGGYKGKSESLLTNFSLGVYLGVNTLENAEMTATGENARKLGVSPYPQMLKWLCD